MFGSPQPPSRHPANESEYQRRTAAVAKPSRSTISRDARKSPGRRPLFPSTFRIRFLFGIPFCFASLGTRMALDDFLLEAEDKMIKTEQVVINEFSGVRTGKASPALVENILVEVYGSQMRIRELAGITTPEARTLNIQPWEVNSLHPIENAIPKSNR